MIRKAEYTDIRRALDIYDSARRFMRSRGNAVQWVNGYPSEELLRADVAAGQLYVMEDTGGVYAVFAFLLGDDPTYAYIEGGVAGRQRLRYAAPAGQRRYTPRRVRGERGVGGGAVSPSAGGHPRRQSDHAAVLGAGGLRPLRDDLCRRRHASRGV